jgi:hypothetical protein
MPGHWMGVSIAAVRALHRYGLADADIARLLKCPLGTVESCRRFYCPDQWNQTLTAAVHDVDDLDRRAG